MRNILNKDIFKVFNFKLHYEEAAWLMTLLELSRPFLPEEQVQMSEHMLRKLTKQFTGNELSFDDLKNIRQPN